MLSTILGLDLLTLIIKRRKSNMHGFTAIPRYFMLSVKKNTPKS